jgi:hypothetical protein
MLTHFLATRFETENGTIFLRDRKHIELKRYLLVDFISGKLFVGKILVKTNPFCTKTKA